MTIQERMRRIVESSDFSDREVNDFVKKLRMDVNDQIDWYWKRMDSAKGPEKEALNAAADFLSKIHEQLAALRFRS
jgi:hypothetical protein